MQAATAGAKRGQQARNEPEAVNPCNFVTPEYSRQQGTPPYNGTPKEELSYDMTDEKRFIIEW